ncbi:hypothetical protein Tco_0534649 [Tanacetum coccineum]
MNVSPIPTSRILKDILKRRSWRHNSLLIQGRVNQKDDGIFISQDKYVADILKKFDFAIVKTANTPIETNKALLKDEEAEDVDVHLYRSMIRSFMYLTAFRPDIMFAVCACARDSPFDLEAFSDSDYAGASLDRKSITGGCQFLGKRLISWQHKKQTIVANSTTEVEYVAAANCCGQNLVFHAKTKHIKIRHHFIRDSYENRLIQVIKIHTDHNVADLLTKAFDVSSISDEFGVKTGGCKVNAARQDLVLMGEINDVKQIHATVDGKTVVISESSVRSDLHFNDEDGITCLTNDAIFENLTLMEYESDSNKLTFQKTLFSPQWKYIIHTILHCLSLKSTWNESSTNIASRVICLANGQKVNFSKLIFDAPATAQPRIEEQIPVTESSSPQNTQTPRQALQEDTHLPQTSVPIPNVAYEDVFKEWDDRVVRATTTTASLDATHASRGNTPGSDEGRPNINELMAICTNMSNRVLALEQSKTAQDLVIRKLKKKGRKSDKTKPIFDDSDFVELDVDNAMENVEGDAETQGRNIVKQITTLKDTVNTASIDVSVAEPLNVSTAGPSTSTVGDIFKDEMMTITDTLVAIRSIRPRTTSVIIHDVEEEPRGQLQPTAQPSSKDKGKALMREQRITREKATEQEAKDDALIEQMEDIQARVDADELLVERIQQEEREQFTIEEKSRMLAEMIVERKRFFAAQRAEQIRNKRPTRAQLRNKMVTYLKHIGKYTRNQMKSKSFEKIQKLYEREKKWINDFVPMDSELEVQRLKRAGQEVLDEPVKRQKIGEASGSGEEQSAKKEKELLEEELQKLLVIVPVEEVYVKALQVKYLIIDREVELKRLFEPDNDDTLWKLQRYMHDPLVCRLYNTCGVHHVSSVRGHDIFMLVKKEYPLTRGTLGLMMVARLLVEADSEMSRELLRKIFYQANIPRQGGLLGIKGFYNFMLLVQVYAAAED